MVSIAAGTCSSVSFDLATNAMLAPSAAKVSAIAAPIPLPPPVTMHHLLAKTSPDDDIDLQYEWRAEELYADRLACKTWVDVLSD